MRKNTPTQDGPDDPVGRTELLAVRPKLTFRLDTRALGRAVTAQIHIQGATLTQAAQVTGLSPTTMWRFQHGKLPDPTASMLGKVCGWLGIPPERFFVVEKGRRTR